MKYVDGFRDRDAGRFMAERIAAVGRELDGRGRTVQIMEVCGSHTMAISRHGIRDLLPPRIRLLSGPGCPVCVTDTGYVDAAIELAERGVVVATFGDLVRVPGSRRTLAEVRSAGGDVRVCYSPAEALRIAVETPGREVVFLGIGFETTMAPVTALIRDAAAQDIPNLTVLTAFKLVPPALRALLADPDVRVDAFLCPPHVSAIVGAEAYAPFVETNRVPCVVCGFEPLDILMGILEAATQLAQGRAELVNQYSRVVRPGGNPQALALFSRFLEPSDEAWRGIGVIPGSGMALRAEYARFDARVRHGLTIRPGAPDGRCRCGDVLKGMISPSDCAMFDTACTPAHPLGPCMVSSEGSCAAHHRYARR
jgi:hydrogenase expression/formation protein HypD